jgi:CHAT domain-containing protein
MKIKSPVSIALAAIFSSIAFFFKIQKNDLFFPEIIDYPHKIQRNALFEAADRAKYAQDYQKANTEFERLLGQSLTPADRHYVLNQLAYINLSMNEDSAAGSWIRLLEKDDTPLSIEALSDFNFNNGVFAYHTFQPKKAEAYLNKARLAYEQLYGLKHIKTALCLTQLGLLYYEFSNADSTLKFIPLAYETFQSNTHLKPYSALCELGMIYVNVVKRSHVEGESRSDNALAILEDLPFKDTLLKARFYCMKGYMLKKQGQNENDTLKKVKFFKEAEKNFKISVELGQQKTTIRLQEFYSELSINYSWLGDSIRFFETIKKMEKLLETQPERYGHPDRLRGYYYYFKSDYLKSTESYLVAWEKLSQDSLRDTKIFLETCNVLAKSFTSLEKYDSALFFFKEYYLAVVNIKEKNIQTKDFFNPIIYKKTVFPAGLFSGMGEILFKKYKKTHEIEALKLAFEAFILTDDLLFPGILTMDEDAVMTFQKEVAEKNYAWALETTYELYRKTKNPFYLDYIFKFCERGKAFLLYRDVSNVDSMRIKNRPPQSILDSIKIFGSEINQLSRQKNFGGFNAKQMTNCKEKYAKIYDDIKRNYPEYYMLKTVQPIASLKSIKAKLRAQQGIIQYYWSNDKIHILYLDKKNTLCFQTEADSTFLRNMSDFRDVLMGEKNILAPDYAKLGFHLYKKLLDTLTPQLKALKEIVIIPDKKLHLLPFEALVTRSLKPQETLNFKTLPYFINNIQTTYSPAWKIYQNNCDKVLNVKPSILAMSYGNQPKIKDNLPNSMQEIDSLVGIMKNALIKPLLKEACTKQNFLNQAGVFDILHLSLHAESNLKDKYDNKIYFKIPLSDTLYGFDIAKMSFKAKLVILSACSTAAGENESSEGTFSLTRSFLQGGVSNVVASLWDISDSQTATILPNFYHQLAKYTPPSVSLHLAKLQYLRTVENVEAHPMYWAGLVCVD